MSARDEALRLLRGHLQASACLVDALQPEEEDAPEVVAIAACPTCGEAREEKLEDTSTVERRVTCLTCGTSFAPAEVKRG